MHGAIRPSHIRQGRIMLCVVHYRMSSMRSRATRDGKSVPTISEIEALVPSPFRCEPCGRDMTWLREQGASIQVSLQHDRSGEVRLICLGCNTRHGAHPGDSFYRMPKGHKQCRSCKQVLPFSSFVVDRSRPIGLKGNCRTCCSTQWQRWNAGVAERAK